MNLHCMLTFLVCSLSILTSLYRLYVCLQFLSCPFVRNGGEVVVVMRQHVVNFLRECLRSHEDLAMAADEASFCVMKGRIIRELTCLSVLLCAVIFITLSSNTQVFYHLAIHCITISSVIAGFGLLCAAWSLWIFIWSGYLENIVRTPLYSYILLRLLGRAPIFALAFAATTYTSHILYIRFARLLFPLLTWLLGPPLFLHTARDAIDFCEQVVKVCGVADSDRDPHASPRAVRVNRVLAAYQPHLGITFTSGDLV